MNMQHICKNDFLKTITDLSTIELSIISVAIEDLRKINYLVML